MKTDSLISTVEKDRSLTFSVQKALRLLQAFSMEKPEQSLVELAARTGLSVSTAHRLLATLEAEGFVTRAVGNAHYRLSIKVFELGSIVLHGMELNVVGMPVLARLSIETEDTTYLTVLSDDQVLCIARIEGVKHLRSQFLAVGRYLPPHAGAASKVLLAYLPPERARSVLTQHPLPAYTENTITDPDDIIDMLRLVRDQGYASSVEEITRGITAIAAPIMDQTGRVVAAVSLSGAASRFAPEHLPSRVEKVRDAGYQISARLGYFPGLTL